MTIRNQPVALPPRIWERSSLGSGLQKGKKATPSGMFLQAASLYVKG